MIAAKLVKFLLEHPDLPVCVDVDDGAQRNYRDVVGVRLVTGALGEQFIAVDADFLEVNKGRRE